MTRDQPIAANSPESCLQSCTLAKHPPQNTEREFEGTGLFGVSSLLLAGSWMRRFNLAKHRMLGMFVSQQFVAKQVCSFIRRMNVLYSFESRPCRACQV